MIVNSELEQTRKWPWPVLAAFSWRDWGNWQNYQSE